MPRHRFDPVSAILAALALVLGFVVATDRVDGAGDHLGWWLGGGAVLIGLALIPWQRRA